MSDGLKFDLTISTSKAAKQAQKFVSDLEKKLQAVPVEFDVQSGVRGLREIKKEAKLAERSIDRLFGIMEKNAKVSAAAVKDECDLLDRMIGLRKKDMTQRVSSAKKEQSGLDETDKRIKRNQKSQSQYNKEVMRGLEEEARFRKQQIERAKARDYADEQRFRSGAASNVHGAHANSAAYDSDLETKRKKQERDEKQAFDRREKAMSDFLHRRDLLHIQYDGRDATAAAEHQRALLYVQQNGHKMSLREIDMYLQKANARYARGLQKASQVKSQGSLFGMKMSNKTMQNAFQAQQMIEDFSYAGFRGASNNLAMMAATMGGPTGLIMLGGATAMVFASVAKELGLLDDILPDVDKKMDDFVSSMERVTELRRSWFEKTQDMDSKQSSFSVGVELEKGQEKEAFAKKELSMLEEKKRLLEALVTINRELLPAELYGYTGTKNDSVDQRRQIKAQLQQQLMSRHGMTGEDLANFDNSFGGLTQRLTKSGKDFDQINEAVRQSQKEIDLARQANQQLAMRKDYLEKVSRQYKEIEKTTLRDPLELSDDASSKSKQYSRAIRDQQEEYDELRKTIEETGNAEANRLARMAEATGDARYYNAARQAIERMRQDIEILNLKTQDGMDETLKWADAWGRVGNEIEDSIKNTERLVEAEKRHIDQIEHRIDALKRAKHESDIGFKGSMFDMERGLSRKDAEEALKNLTEGNKKGLKGDLAANEAQFAPFLVQIQQQDQIASLLGAGAVGAKLHPLQKRQIAMQGAQRQVMKQMLTQEMERRAEAIKASYEGRQERGEKGIQKKLEDQEAALQKKHEDMLRNEASNFGKTGDLESQMSALKELQALQMQQAAQAQTKAQMLGSMNEAAATQKQIHDLHNKMIDKELEKEQEAVDKILNMQDALKQMMDKKLELNQIDIINDRDPAKLEQMKQSLQQIKDMMLGIGDPLAGMVGGMPVAGLGVGKPYSATTSNVSNVSNVNNYNVAVGGMPARPSLTMREAADWAAKNANARTGIA